MKNLQVIVDENMSNHILELYKEAKDRKQKFAVGRVGRNLKGTLQLVPHHVNLTEPGKSLWTLSMTHHLGGSSALYIMQSDLERAIYLERKDLQNA